ncbi:MAG TPA: ABC transporter substrate-binding protein [Gammaproteobacteria bacterium]|nr:ABC transporter substrate-binding protein [Gammaproteobacteria bacterium]
MQIVFIFLAALAALLPVTAAAASPQRIVSIGLCTDQLLLLLADREQIASLSVWAADPDMSYMIDSVGDIPLNNASVEEVIAYRPDLVIASQFAAWNSARFLRRLGYEVRQIPPVKSIDDIYDLLARVGAWIGHPGRAERIIGEMQQKLDQIERRYRDRPRKTVLVYSPNGFTVGADTLENDIFTHAGYRNLAAEMGIEGFRPIALETLLAADPDVLQIDRDLSRPDSLATAYVGHPVLDRFSAQREQLDIPTRLRICGGPMITEAIEAMARRR